jgi:hypothetical protein
MLQDLVFGHGLQGVVKAMLQAKQTTDDLLGNDSFLQRWNAFTGCRASEIAKENVHLEMGMRPPGEDDEATAEAMYAGPGRPAAKQNPSNFEHGSREYWDAVAAQNIRNHIRLVVEPKSVSGVVEAIAASVLKASFQGEHLKSTVITVLEIDNLQEAQQRPWDRRPQVNQTTVNKLLTGVMKARNGFSNEDGQFLAPGDRDMFLLSMGTRSHVQQSVRRPQLYIRTSYDTTHSVPDLKLMFQSKNSQRAKFTINRMMQLICARLSTFYEKKTMTQAQLKEIIVGCHEDSVRARKVRMRSTTEMQTAWKAVTE